MKRFLTILLLLSATCLFSNNSLSLRYHPKFFKIRICNAKTINNNFLNRSIESRKILSNNKHYKKIKLKHGMIAGGLGFICARGIINARNRNYWDEGMLIFSMIGVTVGLTTSATINFIDKISYGKGHFNN